MKTNYITEGSSLHVKGRIWQGQKAEHEYPLNNLGTIPTTLAQAKSMAGDFESLESAKVVTVRREVTETKTTRRLK